MSVLAIAGATAVSAGVAMPFIGRSKPRYRILDKSNPAAYREVKIYVQTRILGVWWTVHKETALITGLKGGCLSRAKERLRERLNGIERGRSVLFDTKFDDPGTL